MECSCLPGVLWFLLAAFLAALFLCKTGFLSSISKAIRRTRTYKKWFPKFILKCWARQLNDHTTLFKILNVMLEQIEERVQDIGGDVMEIGAGTGGILPYLRLPEESSLVVVDYNPYMEKHFRESLAKVSHIRLKDYLVQSAADMNNIPDNTFAVVYMIDVMCSLEIEDLRRMLKEIKRVLKPGGCLFFLEHVLDDPGTWRRTIQRLLASKLGIWPFIHDGCHCDRETVKYVQETGFRSVTASEKLRLYLKEAENGPNAKQQEPMSIYPFNCFVRGCAQK